jgi:hypothetical protein
MFAHKRDTGLQLRMSALAMLALCTLYPRKRTCAVQLGMSALCQKQTSLNR